MNIADRIQKLRKSKGISQEDLALEIGVSRQAVSKWESEQSIPDINKITILSDYFEVTTDYIIKGTTQNVESFDNEPNSIADKLTVHINLLKTNVVKHRKLCITIVVILVIVSMGETILGLLDRIENVLYEFGKNLHDVFCTSCN